MDQDRQQALEQNDLQKALVKAQNRVGGKLPAIVGASIAVLIAVAVVSLVFRNASQADAEAWNEYLGSASPDAFEQVAESFPESPAANWALLAAARDYYNTGVRTAFTDRVRSKEDLAKAQELAGDLLARPGLTAELQTQGQYVLALATEALSNGSEGSVAEAVEAYEPLLASGDAGRVAFAQRRIDDLKNGRAAKFYSWLDENQVRPGGRPQPDAGLMTPEQVMSSGSGNPLGLELLSQPETPVGETAPQLPQGDTRDEEDRMATPADAPTLPDLVEQQEKEEAAGDEATPKTDAEVPEDAGETDAED